LATALSDLSTLTEHEEESKWTMTYNEQDLPFSVETFEQLVPLSPKEYRAQQESRLNEMRVAAGIEPVTIYKPDSEIRQLQSAAGI
jgi:hypothetical protein